MNEEVAVTNGGVFTVEFVPVVALGLFITKFIDVLRYARNRDLNGVVTQLTVWASGAVGFLWVARTQWAAGIIVAGAPVSKLSFWSLVFAGASIASGMSVLVDFKKAVDNTNSAAIPTLLPPGPATTPPTATPPLG